MIKFFTKLGKIFLVFVIFQLVVGIFLTQNNKFEKVKSAHAAPADYNFAIQVDTSAKDADLTRKDGAKMIISWSKPSGAGEGYGYSWHGYLTESGCKNFKGDYQYNFDNTSQYWDYQEWDCKYSFRLLLLKDDPNGTFNTGYTMARIVNQKTYSFKMPKQPSADNGKGGGTCTLAVKMVREDFPDGQVTLHFSWPDQTGGCAGNNTAEITGPGGINESGVTSPYKTSNPPAGTFTFTTTNKSGMVSFEYDPKKVASGTRFGVDADGKPITATSSNSTKNSGTASDLNSSGAMEDKCYQGFFKTAWGMIRDPFGTAVQKMECIVLLGLQNAMSANVISYIKDIMGFSDISATLAPDKNTSGPQATFIINAWDTMHAFINIFMIFTIIVIAFANIFRINIDKYAVKKALPGMVMGVILANFSGLICRGILDVAEVVFGFVTGGAVGGPTAVVLKAFTAFNVNVLLAVGKTSLGMGIPLAIFLLVGFLALALLLAGLLFLFIMAMRVGIIYTLYVLSPLAFLALGSPITSGLFKRWWDDFIKWAFVPVMMFFLLWMAGLTIDGIKGWGGGTADPALWDMIKAIMSLTLIWTAMFLPFKLKGWIGGAVAGFAASKFVNPAQGMVKKGVGYGFNVGKGYAKDWINDSKIDATGGLKAAAGAARALRLNSLGNHLDNFSNRKGGVTIGDVAWWNWYPGWQTEKKRRQAQTTGMHQAVGGEFYSMKQGKDVNVRGDTVRLEAEKELREEAGRRPIYSKSGEFHHALTTGGSDSRADLISAGVDIKQIAKNYDPNDYVHEMIKMWKKGKKKGDMTQAHSALDKLGWKGEDFGGDYDAAFKAFRKDTDNLFGADTVVALVQRRIGRYDQDLANVVLNGITEDAKANNIGQYDNLTQVNPDTGEIEITPAAERAKGNYYNWTKNYKQARGRNTKRGFYARYHVDKKGENQDKGLITDEMMAGLTSEPQEMADFLTNQFEQAQVPSREALLHIIPQMAELDQAAGRKLFVGGKKRGKKDELLGETTGTLMNSFVQKIAAKTKGRGDHDLADALEDAGILHRVLDKSGKQIGIQLSFAGKGPSGTDLFYSSKY